MSSLDGDRNLRAILWDTKPRMGSTMAAVHASSKSDNSFGVMEVELVYKDAGGGGAFGGGGTRGGAALCAMDRPPVFVIL